jgi:selenoprotein W-related protein
MAEILNDPELEPLIETFTLVPSQGGRFEFSVDGQLLYSKLQTGRHVEENELKELFRTHLGGE